MFFIVLLAVLAIIVLLLVFAVVFVFLGLRHIWRLTQPNQVVLRSLVVASGLGVIVSPYVALRIGEDRHVLERVPHPLVVAAIEYRLEKSWGMGFMPGDNETGFVVYQLTDESAHWARQQGNRLGSMLAGAQRAWNPTPVDDSSNDHAIRQWHPYNYDPQMMSESPAARIPTIREYLEKYGFSIPIEEGKDDEVNQALQSVGSFYTFGNGGSVTIVDPKRGKVYFAYAG